jgi:hypothetical protein
MAEAHQNEFLQAGVDASSSHIPHVHPAAVFFYTLAAAAAAAAS